MVEALTDGGLHSQASEALDALGIRRFRDATLARTCSACASVSGGSAIGSAAGGMPASMIASPRRVSDATQRPGSGVGIPGLSRAPSHCRPEGD